MIEPGLMCLIALERPVELQETAVLTALSRTAPRSDVTVTACDPGDGGSGVAVSIDGRNYAAVSFATQMPAEICDMALARGAFWPERHQAIAAHRGFFALSADEPAKVHGLVRAQAVALTRMAAALAGIAPALGVVWPAAQTAFPASRLDKVTAQIASETWPVDLWIGCELIVIGAGFERRFGARSIGAATYFGFEIEVAPQPVVNPSEPLRPLIKLAAYLMAQGPRLQEGQPIRVTGAQSMRVAMRKARDGQPATVQLLPDTAAAG